MTLDHFAANYRLHTRLDECGDKIILGRVGHIYSHGGGRYGVMFLNLTVMKWGYTREVMRRSGFKIRMDADFEGVGLFSPDNKGHARLAIKLARVKRKRNVSEEHIKVMLESLRRYRNH